MEIRKRQEKHIRPIVLIGLVGLLLLGLPLAVWLDLRNLTDAALQRQANDLNSLVTSVRNFYASNVVARVLAAPDKTQVSHMYATIPGAIPIPATLSLELGRVISEQQRNITYRFVSDFPFQNRAPHDLDAFEPALFAGGAPAWRIRMAQLQLAGFRRAQSSAALCDAGGGQRAGQPPR